MYSYGVIPFRYCAKAVVLLYFYIHFFFLLGEKFNSLSIFFPYSIYQSYSYYLLLLYYPNLNITKMNNTKKGYVQI